MEILDDYREPKRENYEGFIPYVSLRNEEVADVMVVLEENKVEFKLKKVMGSTNSTFLVPLSSTQLNHSSTLIYIRDNRKEVVDVILDDYYQGAGQIHLEKRAEDASKIMEQNTEESKRKRWAFFNLSILFLLIILIWMFAEFYQA